MILADERQISCQRSKQNLRITPSSNQSGNKTSSSGEERPTIKSKYRKDSSLNRHDLGNYRIGYARGIQLPSQHAKTANRADILIPLPQSHSSTSRRFKRNPPDFVLVITEGDRDNTRGGQATQARLIRKPLSQTSPSEQNG